MSRIVRAKPPKVNQAPEIVAESMSIQHHLVIEVITPVPTVINPARLSPTTL